MKPGVLRACVLLLSALAPTARAGAATDSIPVVRPGSVVLLPLASVFVPGFGQAAQRRYLEGGAYFAAGASGLVMAANSNYKGDGSMDDLFFDRPGARLQMYGLGLYQGAGFLSAWDTFRAAIPAQQQDKGRFLFIDPAQTESVSDLLLAPFKPKYLVKPSTWIPLGVLGSLAALDISASRASGPDKGGRWLAYGPGDAVFTGALSMNAGATEEAMFRGYMMPLFYQWSGERAWVSNPAQALLFAGAHIGGVTNVPIAQALLGGYLGWLTQRDQWRIGQAVAVHFWWDVIAVSATMFTREEVPVSLGSFSVPVNL
jgi:membrane protease YdiL (CAAX protease family)